MKAVLPGDFPFIRLIKHFPAVNPYCVYIKVLLNTFTKRIHELYSDKEMQFKTCNVSIFEFTKTEHFRKSIFLVPTFMGRYNLRLCNSFEPYNLSVDMHCMLKKYQQMEEIVWYPLNIYMHLHIYRVLTPLFRPE